MHPRTRHIVCKIMRAQVPLQNAANAAWLASVLGDRPGTSSNYGCWAESQAHTPPPHRPLPPRLYPPSPRTHARSVGACLCLLG